MPSTDTTTGSPSIPRSTACSSTTGATMAPGSAASIHGPSVSDSTAPSVGTTAHSASSVPNSSSTTSPMPLNALSTATIAAATAPMTNIEIPEITWIRFRDLRLNT